MVPAWNPRAEEAETGNGAASLLHLVNSKCVISPVSKNMVNKGITVEIVL